MAVFLFLLLFQNPINPTILTPNTSNAVTQPSTEESGGVVLTTSTRKIIVFWCRTNGETFLGFGGLGKKTTLIYGEKRVVFEKPKGARACDCPTETLKPFPLKDLTTLETICLATETETIRIEPETYSRLRNSLAAFLSGRT